MLSITRNKLFISLLLVWIVSVATQVSAQGFITTWKTNNSGSSGSTSITIKTNASYTYSYDVDWENDGTWDNLGLTGDATHNYGVAGTYTVHIRGTFPKYDGFNNGDKLKLLTVQQWGNIVWKSMSNMFKSHTNLNITATDAPNLSSLTDKSMVGMFYSSGITNPDLSGWNVSTITNMQDMFRATAFNGNITTWNTSSVTTMASMFRDATSFNQDIGNWVTTSLTKTNEMFWGASVFNQDISAGQVTGGWDMSKVTNMSLMFSNASAFNQNIGNWNTSAATNMSYVFDGASAFNQNIGSWNTAAVTNMIYMFRLSPFNQNISGWNMGLVTQTRGMFYNNTAFNQNISGWNTSSLQNTNTMFYGATAFNQNLASWDMADVNNATNMFDGATAMTSTNYDAILVGWSSQTLTAGVSFKASSAYCSSSTQRQSIITNYSWTITDLGQSCALDTDADGVADNSDIDDDNDGILDTTEGATVDTDGDGIVNRLDIDSDNDGIPDNVEAQATGLYTIPSATDTDGDGLNNAYDTNNGGTAITVVDTDGDGTYDYLDADSDDDGTNDISENGQGSSVVSSVDTDRDGLDNNFDSVSGRDVNDEVTTGIVTNLTASFGDTDGDVSSGGNLNWRDLFNTNPSSSAHIVFDGTNDYLSGSPILENLSKVIIMAWFKSDTGNATDMVIAGEGNNCRIWLAGGNTPSFTFSLAGGSTYTLTGSAVSLGEWHHISARYRDVTGDYELYVDGTQVASGNVGSTGLAIANNQSSTGYFEIGRHATTDVNKKYFKGAIDEVRVFNNNVTPSQLERIINQEIQDNGGKVGGSITNKAIYHSATTSNTINWTELVAYYPMTDIVTGTISDYSDNSNTLAIHNLSTVQTQTAPMPYVTTAAGAWSAAATWLHGDVWDIDNVSDNRTNRIVQISHNVSMSHNVNQVGLIVDSGATLTTSGDISIQNTWYLELNGTIDLAADSQIIQTNTSDLVTGASGKILRRQEGQASPYRYNYWSSPVGAMGATTLTDNNAATNNTNNSVFRLNMLKDATGTSFTFTSDLTANNNISREWLYTFINGVTYYNWNNITSTTDINPGVGYTQKGTGTTGSVQQYIFEGKPNNGTILISATDTGGAGSVQNVSRTEYLLGNPYPSALDIHQFIDDNVGVIDGTVQLWEQWSGNSHYLNDYDGGYALVTKLGATRAYQFNGLAGSSTSSQDGTKDVTRYMPVSQAFIVEIVANGNVKFNNSQRVFIKEADADGTTANGSVFFRSAGNKSNTKLNNNDELFKKIRLELKSVTGPEITRRLLLGFSSITSDDYDYGYDAENKDVNNTNDLYLNFNGKDMIIQAYSQLTSDKRVALNFKASGDYTFEIKMTQTENMDASQEIYLLDHFTNTYFDLTKNIAYSFSSTQGVFNDRFEVVFKKEQGTLNQKEIETVKSDIYFNNTTNRLYLNTIDVSVSNIKIVNMLGQTAIEFNNPSKNELDKGISVSNVPNGTYLVYLTTSANEILTKKIVVN